MKHIELILMITTDKYVVSFCHYKSHYLNQTAKK